MTPSIVTAPRTFGPLARIWSIAWAGFLQLLRSRIYVNILVAGVTLVGASLLLDRVSAGEGGRILYDIGLAFISLLVAVLGGTIAITSVTRELETKQAHLLLSRPIGRIEFVLGRFVTTALLIFAANLCLGMVLAGLLAATGAEGAGVALVACLFASFEGLIVAAIAIFFGVGSSSTMSAVFTVTLFVAGRLSGELFVLLERGTFGGATPVVRAVYALLPHLSALDLTAAIGTGVDVIAAVRAAGYALLYAAAFLGFAAFRISRRDLL